MLKRELVLFAVRADKLGNFVRREPVRRPPQYSDNALLEIVMHCCPSKQGAIGDILARPSRADAVADAVNVGDVPVLRGRKHLLKFPV